jgi:hypothetical protein
MVELLIRMKVKHRLSTYSDDLGQELKMLLLLMVFSLQLINVELKLILESVEGFTSTNTFCLDNYLKGVKVGVTTMVRVNHQSIGVVTNQRNNRVNLLIITLITYQ